MTFIIIFMFILLCLAPGLFWIVLIVGVLGLLFGNFINGDNIINPN